MNTGRCSSLSVWTAVLFGLAGCASVPPVPPHAAAQQPPPGTRSANGDDDGWLHRSLMEKKGADASTASTPWQPTTAGGVVPASAVMAEAAPQATLIPATAPVPPSKQVYPPPAPQSPPPKPAKKPLDAEDISPEKAVKTVKTWFGYGPDEKTARTAFSEGETLFGQKKYAEAVDKFKTAAGRWPDSLLEEDAMFMLGESYFFCDKYAKAHDTYGELLKKYDNSRYLDTVVKREFAIARYWEQMDDKSHHWPITPNLTDKTLPWFDTFGHADAAYIKVHLSDPTGPLADASHMAAGNAYFKREKFDDAAEHYRRVRKDFPQSKYQKEAHLLGRKAAEMNYDGADYDAAPLKEADEIARSTLQNFGRELGDEKEHVLKATKQITENKALRDFAVGEYYEGKKYYGSARFYYQNVIKEYPLTQTAQRAKERYDAIRDKPDVPKNHFKWLTKVLGDPE